MFKHLFSTESIYPDQALAVVRIITGMFMIYHGMEVFDKNTMMGYTDWDVFKKFPSATVVVYIGKSAEFIAGIMLTLGWGTRIASIILAATMIYITFFVGSGKFWYGDQHPFLFVLLAVIFFFVGPGAWTLFRKQ
jgi:uncharacterized membrane protein YphA (DoxX/SURF4 family)